METKQNFGILEGIFSFCSSTAFFARHGPLKISILKAPLMHHIPQQNRRHHVEFLPSLFQITLQVAHPKKQSWFRSEWSQIPPKARFPFLSIPIYLLVGPWDKPEQIWNKLLLLLCNQILSLPSCSSSSSVEHVYHHHQSPVIILPTKPS